MAEPIDPIVEQFFQDWEQGRAVFPPVVYYTELVDHFKKHYPLGSVTKLRRGLTLLADAKRIVKHPRQPHKGDGKQSYSLLSYGQRSSAFHPLHSTGGKLSHILNSGNQQPQTSYPPSSTNTTVSTLLSLSNSSRNQHEATTAAQGSPHHGYQHMHVTQHPSPTANGSSNSPQRVYSQTSQNGNAQHQHHPDPHNYYPSPYTQQQQRLPQQQQQHAYQQPQYTHQQMQTVPYIPAQTPPHYLIYKSSPPLLPQPSPTQPQQQQPHYIQYQHHAPPPQSLPQSQPIPHFILPQPIAQSPAQSQFQLPGLRMEPDSESNKRIRREQDTQQQTPQPQEIKETEIIEELKHKIRKLKRKLEVEIKNNERIESLLQNERMLTSSLQSQLDQLTKGNDKMNINSLTTTTTVTTSASIYKSPIQSPNQSPIIASTTQPQFDRTRTKQDSEQLDNEDDTLYHSPSVTTSTTTTTTTTIPSISNIIISNPGGAEIPSNKEPQQMSQT